MKKTIFALTILLGVIACERFDTQQQEAALTSATACANPADYGAIPDDGIDDGPAFRAMYASPGVMHGCAGAGHWKLGPYRLASVTLHQGQTLTGVGPATVFDMTGDAGGGAWYGFDVQGGQLRSFSMNQIGIVNPDNAGQNHMIQISAGDSAVVSDVVLGPGGGPGFGDCIRLLGTDSTHQVTRAVISHVVALQCSRDGIGLQHDVTSVSVVGSVFESISDQDLDYEPSSVGPVRGTFLGNIFVHASANHAYAITLSDSDGGNETIFSGNVVINGNVQMTRGDNVAFVGNTILGDPVASTTTLGVIRNSTGLRIEGNYIMRPTSAPVANVVVLNQNNGGSPSNATIASNRIVQGTAAYALYLEGVSRTIVNANNITMLAPWSAGYAVACNSIATSCDLLTIVANVIDSPAGTTKGAVYLGGYTTGAIPIGRALVAGNVGGGFTNSVACGGPFTGPVRIDDNLLGGTIACPGASSGTNL